MFFDKAPAPGGMIPRAPTQDSVEKVAAVPKARGYRTADNYLSTYRVTSERNGYELTLPIIRSCTDGITSCERGLGPSVRSMALPMHRFKEFPG